MTNVLTEEEIDQCKKFSAFTNKADCILKKIEDIDKEKRQKEQEIGEARFIAGITPELPRIQDRLFQQILRGKNDIVVFETHHDCKYFPKSFANKVKEEFDVRLICYDGYLGGSQVVAKYP